VSGVERVDLNGNPTYPAICNSTLNYPRFALSDGKRLFIATAATTASWNFSPSHAGTPRRRTTILGQIGGEVDQATDAADSMNTPTSLAFDGTNLYVADPFNGGSRCTR